MDNDPCHVARKRGKSRVMGEERTSRRAAMKDADIDIRPPGITYHPVEDKESDGDPDPYFDFLGCMHPYRNSETDESDQMLENKDLIAQLSYRSRRRDNDKGEDAPGRKSPFRQWVMC